MSVFLHSAFANIVQVEMGVAVVGSSIILIAMVITSAFCKTILFALRNEATVSSLITAQDYHMCQSLCYCAHTLGTSSSHFFYQHTCCQFFLPCS